MTTQRYPAEALQTFATDLLIRSKLDTQMADTIARVLLEADLLGHTTHGLQLLEPYLKELEAGKMTPSGEPLTLSDHGVSVLWDGLYLPGPWLVERAIDTGLKRLKNQPVFTASIKQSHHIACLAAYLEPVATQGYMILLATSDPTLGSKVAPFGSYSPIYTPNPIAAGWPLNAGVVMLDISMSTTSVGLSQRLSNRNQRLPGKWMLDAIGRPTDDPGVLFSEPSGSMLPLGGIDLGYKGFALGLLVEALTSGLCGFGRKDQPGRWGATVFLMLIDPAALGGREGFLNETSWLAKACLDAEPRDPHSPVRLPGQTALQKKQDQLKAGVALEPEILPALAEWSNRLEVPLPNPVA